MMIRHLAPQRARFRGDELGPSETGIEQARDVALPAEEALAVLHHLVVTPRSVRTVLPAHGFEREVEVGTKAESLGRLQITLEHDAVNGPHALMLLGTRNSGLCLQSQRSVRTGIRLVAWASAIVRCTRAFLPALIASTDSLTEAERVSTATAQRRADRGVDGPVVEHHNALRAPCDPVRRAGRRSNRSRSVRSTDVSTSGRAEVNLPAGAARAMLSTLQMCSTMRPHDSLGASVLYGDARRLTTRR